jgi:SSS family solute:Na+ symporter
MYIGIILGLGAFMMKRQKTTKDYFIANRRIPGWAMGFALMSTLVSNMTFLANPGVAFAGDWTQLTNSFMAPIVLIPIVLIFIPFYRKHIGMSLYEYFERRFNYIIRAYGAVAFLLYYLARMAFIFFVLSLAISTMTGWNILNIIIILGVLTIGYTLIGGIEAVIWSDVIQGILLITGGIVCLGIALFPPGGSPAEVVTMAAEANKFNLGELSFSLQRDSIFVMLLYGMYQHSHNFGTDQTMIQRYLTAKTTKQAKRSAYISGSACLPVWAMFFLVGTAMWGFYQISHFSIPPEVASRTDRIFPFFIMSQLPIGITGLVLAALLASAMSTLDGGLNSAATVFVSDIFQKISPKSTDKHQLFIGRSTVVVLGILSLGMAIWLTQTEGEVLVLYYTAFSIFGGGLLGLFLLAFTTKRANSKGTMIGIVVTIIVIFWATLTKNGIIDLGKYNFNLHPYMIGLVSHVTMFVVGYVASLFFPKEVQKQDHVTIGQVIKEDEL